MTTRPRARFQVSVRGPAWTRNNTSDYEYDSPSDGTAISSDYESVIAEDLDLYEDSLEEVLTDEQISVLNVRFEEFRAADYKDREEIIENMLGSFKSTWPPGVEFVSATVKTLIRQYLYGKVKPVPKESMPNTRSQVVGERQETVLTDQHMSVLERYISKFRTTDPNGREKLVKKVVDHIESTWTEDTGFDRDAMISLIREHLYGKIKRGSKRSTFETRKWSYRDVMTAMNRKKIHKLAKELSKSTPGSSTYLGHYNEARKQVERKLTNNKRRKYKVMAKEWSEKKLPPRMQQRMMIKNGPRAIREFTTSAYNEFGMRIVVLAAYVDGEGDPSIALFDYNDKNGGTSFKGRHKNWKQYQMMEDFSKWGVESLGAPLAAGSEDESARKQKNPEVKLKRNKDGYPILPSLEEIDRHGLLYKKQLIGRFVSDIYEASIGAGKGRVPWAELQRAQGEYIKPKYLPKEVTLQQYYHLRRKDVDAILEHWTQRQAAGKVPFHFRKAAKAIRQNERTSEDNGAATDKEPCEEAEEDPEDDGDSQVRQDLGDGHSATQPSAAADMHGPQQTDGCTAPDLPHTPLPQIQSRCSPHHHPLADGSRAGQTDGPSTENGQSPSGPVGQEPSHNETQNIAHESQPSQLGLTSGADDAQRPRPASPNQADEHQQSPQAERQQSPQAEHQQSPQAERQQSPQAEHQQSPQAAGSSSLGMEKGGRGRHGKHGGGAADAADSPSSKRRKIDCQVDEADPTRRRSTRDRRPTTKATKDSAIPSRTRSRR